MYRSHGDRDSYAAALAVRGYSILQEWLIPEGDGAHAAFLARSPGP